MIGGIWYVEAFRGGTVGGCAVLGSGGG